MSDLGEAMGKYALEEVGWSICGVEKEGWQAFECK